MKKIYWSLGIFFVVVPIVGFITLYEGNPQWNRWIYIYQRYHIADPFADMLEIPTDNFEGAWYTYWPNGNVEAITEYSNNQPVVKVTYFEEGPLKSEASFKNGIMCVIITYSDGGQVSKVHLEQSDGAAEIRHNASPDPQPRKPMGGIESEFPDDFAIHNAAIAKFRKRYNIK